MPVRIIFRGLMLFEFPENGKFVANLINKTLPGGGLKEASNPPKRHGPHEHYHSGEIQILSEEIPEQEQQPGHDHKPILLVPGVDVDILVDGVKEVSRARSFDRHVPDLGAIIANGTGAIREANVEPFVPDRTLIQNVVTVDRGVAHVKSVINWDEENYPLSGNPADRSKRPASPALLKFMGSSIRGHMASEVIVEIHDADELTLRSTIDERKGEGQRDEQKRISKKFDGPRKAIGRPNHRVPAETVEVLVTNYEFRREDPVPWGLDYQWLFETVGYRPAALGGPEFNSWTLFARDYNAASFDSERRILLGGTEKKPVGLPFPYIPSAESLSPLQPMTDEYNPPVCAFGTIGRGGGG